MVKNIAIFCIRNIYSVRVFPKQIISILVFRVILFQARVSVEIFDETNQAFGLIPNRKPEKQ